MATILTTKICLRNDLAAKWTSINPILLAGEIGFERDTGYFKIGDGETAWIDLKYAGGKADVSDIVISVDGQTLSQTANGVLGLHNWGKEYYAWNAPTDTAEGYYSLQVVDADHPWIAGLEPRAAGNIKGEIEIAWYEPNTTTADGIAASIAALQSNVDKLSDAVGTSEDDASAPTIYGRLAAHATDINKNKEDIALANAAIDKHGEKIAALLGLEGGTLTGDLILADGSKAASEAVVDAKIAALGSAGTLNREIVDELPEIKDADTNTIYMVKRTGSILAGDTYAEYMVVDGAWEQIGSTAVDLTNYVEKVVPATENVFAGLAANGTLVDTKIAISDVSAHLDNTDIHVTAEEKKLWNKLPGITEKIKYQVKTTVEGALVNYSDKEIRIMYPADTDWSHQNVGAEGDANMHYFAFRAYAPENAVSFKEDTAEIISDQTMYFFEGNDFAGVDEFGRKYSVVWLPAAGFDTETNAWTYYGENSNKEHYIGWYYSVEWYNVNGKIITSDVVRINLSNESCHNVVEPYYVNGMVKNISINGELAEVVNHSVSINTSDFIKSGDEITVNEDGTLSVKQINASKLTADENSELVLNGGSAII